MQSLLHLPVHPADSPGVPRLWAMWVLATGLCFASPTLVAQDWPGFRGLAQQGVGEGGETATTWSRSENVRWVTRIPGEGNSSPVVDRGRVYVTTGYIALDRSVGFLVIALLKVALVTVLAWSSIGAVLRTCRVQEQGLVSFCRHAAMVAVAAATVVLSVLILCGPELLQYQRCPIRGWLGSSLVVTLCLLLASCRPGAGAVHCLLTGAVAVGYAALVPAAVPNKEHAYATGLLGSRGMTVVAFAAVPLLIGVSCLVSVALGAKSVRPKDRAPGSPLALRVVVLHAVLAVLAAAFVAAMVWRLWTAACHGDVVRPGPAWHKALACFLSATLAGGLVFWWSLARHLPPLPRSGFVPARVWLLRLLAVASVTGLGLFLGLRVLQLAAYGSPFLAYHIGQPLLSPELGPWAVAVFLAACGLAAVVHWASRRGTALVSAVRPWLLWTAAITLACLQVFGTWHLRNSLVLVRAIVCFDQETGKLLWKCEGLPGFEGSLHRLNTPATPTPAVSGERIFAYFGSTGVMCCDRKGRLQWTNENIRFASVYGVGSSPVAFEDVLVIVNGMPREMKVSALDCRDGRILWEAESKLEKERISGNSRTPWIQKIGGRLTCVVWGYDGLTGYDLRTGKVLWSRPIGDGGGDLVASTAADEERVYCVGPTEAVALEVSKLADAAHPVLWRKKVKGANCASPVASNGLLFFISDSGIGSCLDGKTGETLWQRRLEGTYYASPIVVRGLLYFCNADGETTVVAAERAFRQVAVNDLDEQTMATPAPVNGRLLARTRSHLFCIESASAGSSLASGSPGALRAGVASKP